MSRIASLALVLWSCTLYTGCAMLDDQYYDDDVYEAEYHREPRPRLQTPDQPRKAELELRQTGPGIYNDRN